MTHIEPTQTKNCSVDELTPRQARLVAALLAGNSVTEAARRSGIGRSTARRYMQQEAVQKALRTGQREAVGELSRFLGSTERTAVETLLMVARDKSIPAAVRVRAANALLGRRLEAAQIEDIEQRLDLLEQTTADDSTDSGWNR